MGVKGLHRRRRPRQSGVCPCGVGVIIEGRRRGGGGGLILSLRSRTELVEGGIVKTSEPLRRNSKPPLFFQGNLGLNKF